MQEALDKAVSVGANRCRGVTGLDKEADYPFTPSVWWYFGVCDKNNTECSDNVVYFGKDAILLTLDQVEEHLGLTKPDPVAETAVQPKSLANVKLDCRKPDGSVDEELSRAFQEACFEQGIEWIFNGNITTHLNARFLFTADNHLTFAIKNEDIFKNDKARQEIKFTYERKLVWDYEVVAKEEVA